MSKGVWKVDDKEHAVYIDIEDESADSADPNIEYSNWNNLPDLLLEKVFSYLSIRERYYASMVCRAWYRAFHLPYVWSTFVLEDTTLTRRKFNYYYGWQHVLDHLRTQMCLTRVGTNFKRLVFEPMLNFYNLYEFMNMVSYFAERQSVTGIAIGPNIRSLCYTFPCNMAVRDEAEAARTYGTGGKLLEALKRLMGNLSSLRHLELIDLMLEPCEAQHLLDEVCQICCLTLKRIVVINTTKVQYELLHVGVFLNLQVLFISPQNLGDNLVELLGETKLQHLHIIQNRFTPGDVLIMPVSPRAWRQCRRSNPQLAVHFEMDGVKERDVLWQEYAPVRSIVYNSAFAKITSESVLNIVDLYSSSLWVYGHKGLPRFHRPKSFHERVDSLVLLLCRQCPYLHTLMIRERISTATVLLLAHTAKNLRYLFVRRNAVILRSDWPQSPDWTLEFYQWLRTTSKSYNATEREVSQILGYSWYLLSDKQFKLTSINLHYVPY